MARLEFSILRFSWCWSRNTHDLTPKSSTKTDNNATQYLCSVVTHFGWHQFRTCFATKCNTPVKELIFYWSFDRKTYTWSSPKSSHSWNPADFAMKSVKSGGFHPWNPANFMKSVKSGGFHPEIWRISPRYHLWNPPKIIKASVSAKTLQFDECRVGDFTLEIHQISPWNLVDFTRYHLWNPPKL